MKAKTRQARTLGENKKEAAAFVAAAFGVAWLLWLGAYIFPAPASQGLVRLGTAAPSVMGLIFTAAFGGRPALRALLRAALRFRALRKLWLYAVCLFPGILLCALALYGAAGGALPAEEALPLWALPLAFLYIFACMGPLGEELGWRGFLLGRFLSRWGLAKSGFLLGLVWSAWHLPLFVIPGTIQSRLAELGLLLAVPGYFVYTVCICLLMTVLYVRSGGNLLLCMVFHTVCNLSLGAAPIILNKGGAAALLGVLIPVTVFVLRAERGKRPGP